MQPPSLGIGTPAVLPSRDGGSRRRDARSSVLVLRRRCGLQSSLQLRRQSKRRELRQLGRRADVATRNISYAPTLTIWSAHRAVPLLHGAIQLRACSRISARDVVVNFHVGIPHRFDAGRDDVQLLWDSESLHNKFYSTTNDITSTAGCGGLTTGAHCANNIGLGARRVYVDSITWTCPSAVGNTFTAPQLNAQAGCVDDVLLPEQHESHGSAESDSDQRQRHDLEQPGDREAAVHEELRFYGVLPALRLHVLQRLAPERPADDVRGLFGLLFAGLRADVAHARHQLRYQNQINAQNLVSVQASYVTANSIRDNNQLLRGRGEVSRTDRELPRSVRAGIATARTGGRRTGALPQEALTTLGHDPDPGAGGTSLGHRAQSEALRVDAVRVPACRERLARDVQPGHSEVLLGVADRRISADRPVAVQPGRPSRQLHVPRLEHQLPVRRATSGRNAYNLDNCVNNISGKTGEQGRPRPQPDEPCPSGYIAGELAELAGERHLQHLRSRVSAERTRRIPETSSVSRTAAIRKRRTRRSSSTTRCRRTSRLTIAANFYAFGRTSPGYPIAPPTSINYDISWEHHFKGTDMSFKLTPFLRQTQDQIQQLLPRSENWVCFRLERRRPAQPRHRVPVPKG